MKLLTHKIGLPYLSNEMNRWLYVRDEKSQSILLRIRSEVSMDFLRGCGNHLLRRAGPLGAIGVAVRRALREEPWGFGGFLSGNLTEIISVEGCRYGFGIIGTCKAGLLGLR